MRAYLDTSAALKLLVQEAESDALLAELAVPEPDRVVLSSWLLHTELHCAATRRPDSIPVARIQAVLDVLSLVDLTRADLRAAADLETGLRSQDAIHLAVALRTEADTIVTYDQEQAAAARAAGLEVLQPD